MQSGVSSNRSMSNRSSGGGGREHQHVRFTSIMWPDGEVTFYSITFHHSIFVKLHRGHVYLMVMTVWGLTEYKLIYLLFSFSSSSAGLVAPGMSITPSVQAQTLVIRRWWIPLTQVTVKCLDIYWMDCPQHVVQASIEHRAANPNHSGGFLIFPLFLLVIWSRFALPLVYFQILTEH